MIYDTGDFRKRGKTDKSIRPALRKASFGNPTPAGDRQVKFVFSSSAIDRDFDSIDQSGIDVSTFIGSNPVILWGHDQHSMPVGKCVSVGIEDGKLVGVIEFAPADLPGGIGDKAEALFRMCRTGFLSCVSIGFVVREWSYSDDPDRLSHDGTDIHECELLEVSLVAVPSNRQAVIQEVSGAPAEPVAEPVQEPTVEDKPKRLRAARLKRLLAVIDD